RGPFRADLHAGCFRCRVTALVHSATRLQWRMEHLDLSLARVAGDRVSMRAGLTAMARRGVLIKGGTHLESIGKLRALAVDKTGTITEGKPKVTKVIPWNNHREEEIVR